MTVTALSIIKKEKNSFLSTLPATLTPEKEAYFAIVLSQVKTLIAKKSNISVPSVLLAVKAGINLGLSFDATRGECYLIPRGNMCTFLPGYRGLLRLAYNAGVKNMSAHCVYEGDDFEYWIDENGPKLKHAPRFIGDRGKLMCAYSMATLPDGSKSLCVLSLSEIEKAKKSAQTTMVWNAHNEEMTKKTVLRKHCKTLPLSTTDEKIQRLNRALDIEEKAVDLNTTMLNNEGEQLIEDKIINVSELEEVQQNSIPDKSSKPQTTKIELEEDSEYGK